jgi:alkylhydroperoxidase family enzyme
MSTPRQDSNPDRRKQMTRIAYRQPEEMTEQARELTLERGNLNVYRALANADEVFTGWMLAGRAILTSPVLPIRLREFVVLRTAYLMDSPYELGQHRDVARTAGLSRDEINAITSGSDWQEAHFSPVELAVLHLTSELVTTQSVSAAVFDQVHRALGSEATVEVLMVISRYAGLALMLNALDVDLDESARLPVPPRREPS